MREALREIVTEAAATGFNARVPSDVGRPEFPFRGEFEARDSADACAIGAVSPALLLTALPERVAALSVSRDLDPGVAEPRYGG